MEKYLINLIIITITILVIVIIENLLFRRIPSEKQVRNYQKKIDSKNKPNKNFSRNIKRSAVFEILQIRKEIKFMIYIWIGFTYLFLIMIGKIEVYLNSISLALITVSFILFITLAIIKLIENRKIVIYVSIFVLTIGLFIVFQIEKFLIISIFSFLIVVGVVSLLLLFIFIKNK